MALLALTAIAVPYLASTLRVSGLSRIINRCTTFMLYEETENVVLFDAMVMHGDIRCSFNDGVRSVIWRILRAAWPCLKAIYWHGA